LRRRSFPTLLSSVADMGDAPVCRYGRGMFHVEHVHTK
jgi:hypothetical protein